MNHVPDADRQGHDEGLKQAIRRMPSPLSVQDNAALQERILAQWQSSHGQGLATPSVSGPALVLRAAQQRSWRAAAVALLMAMVAASGWWAWQARQEPVIDEDLLHPDVLTLMAIEEM